MCFISLKVHVEKDLIYNKLKKLLPEYMIPTNLFYLDTLPKNRNGKINKKELFNIWEKFANET